MQTSWPVSYADVTSSSFHSQPCLTFRDGAHHAPMSTSTMTVGKSSNVKHYSCTDCTYTTDRKNNLKRHRTTMHERSTRTLECCGIIFTDKSTLRNHVTTEHGAGTGYACGQCGRRFGRRALMRRHVAVHDAQQQQYQQQIYGISAAKSSSSATFSSKSAPTPRLTTDSTNGARCDKMMAVGRRFSCPACEYSTGHKSNLERHLRRHIGGSSFTRTLGPRSSPAKTPSGLTQLPLAATTTKDIQQSYTVLSEMKNDGDATCSDTGVMFERKGNDKFSRAAERRCGNGCVGHRLHTGGPRGYLNSSWPTRQLSGGFQAAAHRIKRLPTSPHPVNVMMSRRSNGVDTFHIPPAQQRFPPMPPAGLLPFFDHLAAATAALNDCRGPVWPSKSGDIAEILQTIARWRHFNQQQQQLNNQSINIAAFDNIRRYLSSSPNNLHQVYSSKQTYSPHFVTESSEMRLPKEVDNSNNNDIIKQEEIEEVKIIGCDGRDDDEEEEEDNESYVDVDADEDEDIEVDGEEVSFDLWNMPPVGESRRASDASPDDVIAADTDDEDVGQSKPRCRLLPLLHTCRACAVTFASQLQLKMHVDESHQSEEAEARDTFRPITSRDRAEQSQPLQQQSQKEQLLQQLQHQQQVEEEELLSVHT